MIKERGQVVQIDEQFIWVETAIKSTCSSCAAKSNCGTSSVAEAFAGKSVINKVRNHLKAQLHDQVEIGIPEESLIQGAFWVYLAPLISAILFALGAEYWLSRFIDIAEWQVIIVTILGGAVGFGLAKYKLKSDGPERYEPQLLEVLSVFKGSDGSQDIEVKQVN